MNQHTRYFTLFHQILTAFCCAVFIFSGAVSFTLMFRPLYVMDLNALQIPERSGLSRDVCLDNYNALIDYNMFWHNDPLKFPDFPMSDTGREHFAEVKNIFVSLQYAALISGAALVLLLLYRRRCVFALPPEDVPGAAPYRKKYQWLLWTVLTVLIPSAAIGVFMLTNWEQGFVLFHDIVFGNDYWIFDPVTDPVINILPDTFFLHCLVMILVLMAASLAVCFAVWLRKGRKTPAEKVAAGRRG